jgi:hypothetical protein
MMQRKAGFFPPQGSPQQAASQAVDPAQDRGEQRDIAQICDS